MTQPKYSLILESEDSSYIDGEGYGWIDALGIPRISIQPRVIILEMDSVENLFPVIKNNQIECKKMTIGII